jgi:hypothetical protein
MEPGKITIELETTAFGALFDTPAVVESVKVS